MQAGTLKTETKKRLRSISYHFHLAVFTLLCYAVLCCAVLRCASGAAARAMKRLSSLLVVMQDKK
jgi:hypothetical protein